MDWICMDSIMAPCNDIMLHCVIEQRLSMKPKISVPREKLSELFRKGMFWDVDMDKLDVKRDYEFIIPRVLNRFMDQIEYLENLEKIYPKDMIIYYAKNSSEIRGNEKIEILANRYELDPKDFPNYLQLDKYY